MRAKAASAWLFATCGVALLLTWHGYEGHPLWIWSERPSFYLNSLDFALKVAGLGFLGLALLVWPRKTAS